MCLEAPPVDRKKPKRSQPALAQVQLQEVPSVEPSVNENAFNSTALDGLLSSTRTDFAKKCRLDDTNLESLSPIDKRVSNQKNDDASCTPEISSNLELFTNATNQTNIHSKTLAGKTSFKSGGGKSSVLLNILDDQETNNVSNKTFVVEKSQSSKYIKPSQNSNVAHNETYSVESLPKTQSDLIDFGSVHGLNNDPEKCPTGNLLDFSVDKENSIGKDKTRSASRVDANLLSEFTFCPGKSTSERLRSSLRQSNVTTLEDSSQRTPKNKNRTLPYKTAPDTLHPVEAVLTLGFTPENVPRNTRVSTVTQENSMHESSMLRNTRVSNVARESTVHPENSILRNTRVSEAAQQNSIHQENSMLRNTRVSNVARESTVHPENSILRNTRVSEAAQQNSIHQENSMLRNTRISNVARESTVHPENSMLRNTRVSEVAQEVSSSVANNEVSDNFDANKTPSRRMSRIDENRFSVFDDSCTNPKSIALGGDSNNSNGTTIVSSNRRLSRSRRSSKSVTFCRSNDRKSETIGNFTTVTPNGTLALTAVPSNSVTQFTETLPFEVTKQLSKDPRAPNSKSFLAPEVSFLVPSSTNRKTTTPKNGDCSFGDLANDSSKTDETKNRTGLVRKSKSDVNEEMSEVGIQQTQKVLTRSQKSLYNSSIGAIFSPVADILSKSTRKSALENEDFCLSFGTPISSISCSQNKSHEFLRDGRSHVLRTNCDSQDEPSFLPSKHCQGLSSIFDSADSRLGKSAGILTLLASPLSKTMNVAGPDNPPNELQEPSPLINQVTGVEFEETNPNDRSESQTTVIRESFKSKKVLKEAKSLPSTSVVPASSSRGKSDGGSVSFLKPCLSSSVHKELFNKSRASEESNEERQSAATNQQQGDISESQSISNKELNTSNNLDAILSATNKNNELSEPQVGAENQTSAIASTRKSVTFLNADSDQMSFTRAMLEENNGNEPANSSKIVTENVNACNGNEAEQLVSEATKRRSDPKSVCLQDDENPKNILDESFGVGIQTSFSSNTSKRRRTVARQSFGMQTTKRLSDFFDNRKSFGMQTTRRFSKSPCVKRFEDVGVQNSPWETQSQPAPNQRRRTSYFRESYMSFGCHTEFPVNFPVEDSIQKVDTSKSDYQEVTETIIFPKRWRSSESSSHYQSKLEEEASKLLTAYNDGNKQNAAKTFVSDSVPSNEKRTQQKISKEAPNKSQDIANDASFALQHKEKSMQLSENSGKQSAKDSNLDMQSLRPSMRKRRKRGASSPDSQIQVSEDLTKTHKSGTSPQSGSQRSGSSKSRSTSSKRSGKRSAKASRLEEDPSNQKNVQSNTDSNCGSKKAAKVSSGSTTSQTGPLEKDPSAQLPSVPPGNLNRGCLPLSELSNMSLNLNRTLLSSTRVPAQTKHRAPKVKQNSRSRKKDNEKKPKKEIPVYRFMDDKTEKMITVTLDYELDYKTLAPHHETKQNYWYYCE